MFFYLNHICFSAIYKRQAVKSFLCAKLIQNMNKLVLQCHQNVGALTSYTLLHNSAVTALQADGITQQVPTHIGDAGQRYF